jgi:hypothetical protein
VAAAGGGVACARSYGLLSQAQVCSGSRWSVLVSALSRWIRSTGPCGTSRARCGVHLIGSGTTARSVAAESAASGIARGGAYGSARVLRWRVGRDVHSRAAQSGVYSAPSVSGALCSERAGGVKENPLETPARKIMLFRNPDSQGFLAGGCPERPPAPLMDAIT